MARKSSERFLALLDVLAISAWGILFLKYWLTGKLFLLIHPNYIWLTVASGVVLVLLAGWKFFFLLKQFRQTPRAGTTSSTQHMTFFPPGWGSSLLLAIAILSFIISPRAFASDTAIQRGVTDTLALTRTKPQAFRISSRSEDKSLIDWIRTLSVYPEPDAYTGQKVKVQGFVTYSQQLPEQYFLISRFVITCCAADAYPVSLPVKLTQNRTAYKPDSWLEIEGQMITERLAGKRQLTIQAQSLKSISEPKNPYDY
ncbi:MAG: TIGR03943 family protein [Scytolyngbya sp. HA4215-MV1]|jgi:uncharacterized repeat protein (TIGR03943 family)|nr:TIGR03943 family protein [Scytolyngbya sp. HA4215-MV1]